MLICYENLTIFYVSNYTLKLLASSKKDLLAQKVPGKKDERPLNYPVGYHGTKYIILKMMVSYYT
ncbi:hypothetical protein BpHYR1_045160 [Brachionus plicatilis]|uniref:Uncharacterized protein n=1 Tax=Brachionus plicatilis TaxID=10195 RepID=A0A3M7SJU0_BRAPC|nr:hypothetical protein BpHYR1_045160 [Brachionus plicatilis]